MTFTLSGFTFSAQVLHPLLPLRRMMALAGVPEMMLYLQSLLIASVLIQIVLKMGFVLLAMRRWRLPLGSLTLVFTLNGLLMCTLAILAKITWLIVILGDGRTGSPPAAVASDWR